MSRFEAAVRSPIAFSRTVRSDGPAPSVETIRGAGPETVGIEFADRLFVWHAFPPEEPRKVGEEKWEPTVTVVLDAGDDEGAAADDVQRFLSALVFHTRQPAEAVSYLSTEIADPFQPAVLKADRMHVGWFLTEPPDSIVMRPEPALQAALAYFREGLTASSPFYRFLALWNAIDAAFEVTRDTSDRDAFIRTFATRASSIWLDPPIPSDLAATLQEDSRNAIAHVLRDRRRRAINPDSGADRVRLGNEATVLAWIAESAIEERFPGAVRVLGPADRRGT